MNISLKIQKWSEKSFIKVSEIKETESFLVLSMNNCISLLIDDINLIGKMLKEDDWNIYSIDYRASEETMEIWFSR